MFYSAFGFIEHFEDTKSVENNQSVENTKSVENNQSVENTRSVENNQSVENTRSVENNQSDENNQSVENIQFYNSSLDYDNKLLRDNFNLIKTALPFNFIHFNKKLNIEIYNLTNIDISNLNNKFYRNIIGIILPIIFNFKSTYIGANIPFVTNVINYNNPKKEPNKINFKYFDYFNYEIDLISGDLIDKGLYNIIYLPIQPITKLKEINFSDINDFNLYNGKIISINNDITIYLSLNNIIELYILPYSNVRLTLILGDKTISSEIIPIFKYTYIYFNFTNKDPLNIQLLNIVNLFFITIPTNVNLLDNSNLIYYNNFVNYNNTKFYNNINKAYDTTIMNCTNNCVDNIALYGSRYSKNAYNGTNNVYMSLPDLNLSNKTITFSMNFKTQNTSNQVLFDIGHSLNNYITSLFVNFENNTLRFNYVKNNELTSTFLYAKENPLLNDNKWHNFIWTLVKDKWIIFVDGVKIFDGYKESPNSSIFNCTTSNSLIGKKNNFNLLFNNYTNFIGIIDNFKIFNKVLSNDEILNENIN